MNAGYAKGAGQAHWARASTLVFYPKLPAGGFVCLAAIAFAFAVGFFRPGARRLALCTAFLAVSAGAQAFVNYHGDAAEVPRHMAVSGLLLRLALVFALATALRATPVLAGGGAARRKAGLAGALAHNPHGQG
jgi:hypothetical protein